MSTAAIAAAARAAGLSVAGTCATQPEDGLAAGARGVVLLSPDEPAFWDILTASPEWQDGAPDPVDRWSRRVIGAMAATLGLEAAFPFGGPPWMPFTRWALRSGRCHTAPVGLLVHDEAGLFVSFRGALLLPERPAPEPRPSPCDSCAGRPCLSACPVGALGSRGYDVPACHAHLDTLALDEGCRTGCLVRRACPVGQGRRQAAQSAHHMRYFHR
ncbi:MAG: ferredoxin [Rubellimicrobium sp.]|nr:ferredoxin [Rubellimicrobium sp.]